MISFLFVFVLLFCIGKWTLILWKSNRKKDVQPDHSYIIFKDYSQSFEKVQHKVADPLQAAQQTEKLIAEDSKEVHTKEREEPLQAILNFEN